MKYMKKCSVMIILMILFIAYPKVEAKNDMIVKQDSKKVSSSKTIDGTSIIINGKEKEAEDKPKCQYKEGEVIITYEQSFWNSKTKLSLDSMINKYIVDETIEFDEIKIDSDNTVSISDDDSIESTLAVSLVKSDKHTTKELINLFKDKEWIISVEPNYMIQTTSITNDTYSQYQWALDNTGQITEIKGLDINPISTSSGNEKVIAVLDSGVDYTHEDLKNVMWVNPYSKKEVPGTYGYDFINNDDDPMDDNLHGTHVAGIIASNANNNVGISGTVLGADNIRIMALKVGDNKGVIDLYSTIEAYNYIYKVQELGTNVIAVNNSWAGPIVLNNVETEEFMKSLTSAINLVGEKGALSVCSASNEGIELDENGNCYFDISYVDDEENVITENKLCKYIPCGLDSDYVISVGASTSEDKLASFSNYGKSIDILAPGTEILSTVLDKNEDEVFSRFIPAIYTEEKKNKTCDIYYDFENCDIKDIPFITNNGTLSIVNDRSFVNGSKCLKWEFDINDGDNAFLYLNNTGIDKEKVAYVSAMISTLPETTDDIVMGTDWEHYEEEGMINGQKTVIDIWYWSDYGMYTNSRRWTLGDVRE